MSKVISQLLWFCIATLCDLCDKISRHLINQLEAKPKPIVTCSHAFSRAWHRLHVFASSSDWFIGLPASVVIGQSDTAIGNPNWHSLCYLRELCGFLVFHDTAIFPFINRLNDATVKLDRIMECVLDTTGSEDSEGVPKTSQPNHEWRPPTRDFGGLERRLARMEDNISSLYETVKTMVDLLHSQKVGSADSDSSYCLLTLYPFCLAGASLFIGQNFEEAREEHARKGVMRASLKSVSPY